MQWFDMSDGYANGPGYSGLIAMQAATDALYNMPQFGTDPVTGQINYTTGITSHYTTLMPHPTQANRWAMPITDDCISDVQNIINQATSAVTAGSTDLNQIALAGLPELILQLDSSWNS